MSDPDDPLWVVSTPRRQEETPGADLRSVGIALDVLECFTTDAELGVTDIARRVGVAKSTAHRTLATLVRRAYVEQGPATGKYRLGIHVYELGQLAQARSALRHAALPVMRYVSDTTGLTVNLSVPDGADMVFVERLEKPGLEQHLEHIGRRLPAHVTSSGKVVAAFNLEVDTARRAAGFPPRVSRTVRSESDWERELDLARRHGFATSESESFNDVSTVAVPILNMRGLAIASLSLMGPTERIHVEIPRLAQLLRTESRRIGRQL